MTTALMRYRDPEPRELEHTGRDWLGALAAAAEYAKAIAPTEFVPRGMRNNPPAITACILYGDEIGIGPMVSLNTIAMIDGHPTLLAKIQRALVQAAGHSIWPEELTATRATWCGRRRDEEVVTRVTWTMDDARRANLAGRPTYRQYPRAMLSARASAELVGAIFSDVVGGLLATEELEGDGSEAKRSASDAGAADAPAVGVGVKRRRQRPGRGVAAPAPEAGAMSPPEVLPPLPWEAGGDGGGGAPEPATTATEEPARMLTDGQRRRMHALFRDRGVTDRGDRLRYTSAVIGRVVTSAKEMTAAEGDALLTALELERAPDPEPAPDTEPDDGDGGA